MKSHAIHLTLNVPAQMDFANITDQAEGGRSAIRAAFSAKSDT